MIRNAPKARQHVSRGFNLKGYNGLFLSSGCYGDVFRPPLPCEGIDGKFSSIHYVGKVFEDREEGMEQYKLEKVLVDQDPDHLFSLHPVAACAIQPTKIQMASLKKIAQAKDLKDGENYRDEREYYTFQIVYPFGGYNFFNYVNVIEVQKKNLSLILNPALFLMMQLGKLNKNGLYHFDIKNENILYNEELGLLRVIDFQFLARDMDESVEGEIDRGAIKIIWQDKRTKQQTRKIKNFNMTQTPEVNAVNYLVNGGDEPSLFMYFDYVASNMNRLPREFEQFANRHFRKDFPQQVSQVMETGFYKKLKRLCQGYKEAVDGAKETALEKIEELFNSPNVINSQETFTYGMTFLSWIWVVYSHFSSNADATKVLDDILGIVCDKMITLDVESRLSLEAAHKEIVVVLHEKHKDYYKSYNAFYKSIMKNKKSPDTNAIKKNHK